MPYLPVPRPNGLPPHVASAVDRLERHYLEEVHVMLRLPIPTYRLSSTCTFSCAQSLLGLIGGISTMLYAHRDGSPGKDFKDLLIDFYPWDREPSPGVTPLEGAKIIYDVFRNPLTHNLGAHVRRKATTPKVKVKRGGRGGISKGGLTERMIERLEREPRPGVSAAVTVRPGDATVLFVEPLYWGVRVMLSRLLNDGARMAKAEAFLAKVS
jgi:hypothetical protein